MKICDKKIYGLIGYPLGHSFSQGYFNKKFECEDINAAYRNFEIATIEEFPSIITDTPDIYGLNVTIPYKEKVIPYLDALDTTAEAIGAVNVIKILRDNEGAITGLKGYNSDCIGFIESIKPLIGPGHKKALVLGTGGAAKAVYYGLKTLGLEPMYVSRSPKAGQYTYDDLKLKPEILAEYTVIVNTTPLGMHPKVEGHPDIPYHRLTANHVCYDVVYNPEITTYMKLCAEQGAATKNGIEMLHKQAEAAWAIWNM